MKECHYALTLPVCCRQALRPCRFYPWVQRSTPPVRASGTFGRRASHREESPPEIWHIRSGTDGSCCEIRHRRPTAVPSKGWIGVHPRTEVLSQRSLFGSLRVKDHQS